MSDKIADVFYKKKGQKKPTYLGAAWESKFSDEQRAEGKEPWLDLNLSIVDGETRVYATEIKFGSKTLKLGKDSGVFLKIGLCKGFTVAAVETSDFVTEEDAASEETAEDGVDVTELS